MKKLYFFMSVIISLVASIGFSSCSKDNDNDPKPEASVKMRPTKITWTENAQSPSSSDVYVYDNIVYTHDLQVSSYRYEEFGEICSVSYEYNSNYIRKTKSEFSSRTDNKTRNASHQQGEVIYNLSNGLIINSDEENFNCQYDNNYLKKVGNGSVSRNYNWQNNNLSDIEMFYSDKLSVYSTTNFIYTDYPLYVWIESEDGSREPYDNCDQFLVRQGYFGNTPKNMIKEITWVQEESGRKDITSYEYVFNKNGYPTKITTSTLFNSSSLFMNVVEIEWEEY